MSDTQNNMNMQNEDFEMRVPESYVEGSLRSHIGPILGVITLMLALILGGLYIWGGMLTEQAVVVPPPIINNEPETPRAEADIQILKTLSPSDEISAIEADLLSTDNNSLDADLTTIDAEFEAALAQ